MPTDVRSPSEMAVVKRMEKIIGYVPIGTRDLMHVLTHPDLIDLTKAWIASIDGDTPDA